MQTIHMIICDAGDGSNYLELVKDPKVLEKIRELADEGEYRYQSGDGLQEHTLQFTDDFDVDAWVKLNFYGYTTMGDFE